MPTAAAVTHEWISAISAAGAVTQSQPAFTDISGAATNAQLPAPIQIADGNAGAPSYSFTNENGSGLYRNGTADISISVTGTQAFDFNKLSSTQINVGLGGAAAGTVGNALSANYTRNGAAHYNYANLSQGTSAQTCFESASGAGASVLIKICNNAYNSTAYWGGGSYLDADSSNSFLNIVSENSGGYITMNVGGAPAQANEIARFNTGDLTINKPIKRVGSTSGTLTEAVPATITSYTATWPAAQGGASTSLSNDGSGNLTWVAILTNPMTTLGDLPYGGASGAVTRLAGDTSNTKKFLSETSSGGTAAAPTWATIATGDVPTLNQNTSGSAASLSATLAVGSGGTGQVTAGAAFNALAPSTAKGGLIVGSGSNTYANLAVGTNGQIATANSAATNGADFETVAGNSAIVKAPTVQTFTSTGSQTGWLFTISTSSTMAVGDTYTNNGHTYTAQVALAAQSGAVLWMSGTGATSGTTLTRSAGSGTSSITFSTNQATALYTTPSSPSPLYLRIKMAGAGGGGAGSSTIAGNNGGAGSNGLNSYFGGNLLTAGGGTGASGGCGGGAGAGGTNSLGGIPAVSVPGGDGSGSGEITTAGNNFLPGTAGGTTFLGGGGQGGPGNSAGGAGATNTGAGGGGAGGPAAGCTGAAGGAGGGIIDAIISAPAATYPYVVGTGGTHGSAGASGFVGGDGAAGVISVIEHYQ